MSACSCCSYSPTPVQRARCARASPSGDLSWAVSWTDSNPTTLREGNVDKAWGEIGCAIDSPPAAGTLHHAARACAIQPSKQHRTSKQNQQQRQQPAVCGITSRTHRVPPASDGRPHKLIVPRARRAATAAAAEAVPSTGSSSPGRPPIPCWPYGPACIVLSNHHHQPTHRPDDSCHVRQALTTGWDDGMGGMRRMGACALLSSPPPPNPSIHSSTHPALSSTALSSTALSHSCCRPGPGGAFSSFPCGTTAVPFKVAFDGTLQSRRPALAAAKASIPRVLALALGCFCHRRAQKSSRAGP